MEIEISKRLAILGHPQRLALFRLLMRRYPDHVPATELAGILELKPNTLSSYIGALLQVGLVTQERIGTSLRYAINIEAARETIDYLVHECCRGRPDICAPMPDLISQGDASMTEAKFKVLFICTGNSARSIFAETLLRDLAGERFDVFSAGTLPRSELNPFAVDVLKQKGHDTAPLRSKNIQEFQGEDAPRFDFVFTVCNQAANEECPAWHGQPVSANWGLPDPVKAEGTDAEKSLAFHQTYGALRSRITAFSALPVDSLDRITLQKAVDEIGRTSEGTP